MHRSGTSMLASRLAELGVFLGHRLQPGHHEARLFQSLNTWLLRQESGGWDNPEPVRLLLEEPRARAVAAEYLRHVLGSPRALSFLGPTRYVRHRTIAGLREPWGWKDPRSTFTLPIWLDLFPEAKVIHVLRHGVDVAESLRVRQERVIEGAPAVLEGRKWRYSFTEKGSGFTRGLRFADLDEGLRVWDLYVAEARRHGAALGERAIELRYEDFLARPEEHLERLATFCGLQPSVDAVQAAARGIDASRAYPFSRSEHLVHAAHRNADRLASNGYHPVNTVAR